MASRLLTDLEHASPARESAGRHFREDYSLEFHRSHRNGAQDGLGCIRGVVTALGIQALVLILALAIWKLH